MSRRMRHHATAEELASLDADALKPRKSAKISAHLAVCVYCQEVNHDLVGVSTLLATASMQYQAMPDQMSARIDAALRAEATRRLSSEPATEAGRRDLPSRHRAPAGGRRWRLSVPATRLVAAAGALIIVGAGGYELASHVGTNTGTSASSSNAPNAAIPRAVPAQPALGPKVIYQHAGLKSSIQTVSSSTNFVHSKLGVQAVAAVAEASKMGITPTGASDNATTPAASTRSSFSTDTASPAAGRSTSNSQLDGCVANVAGDQKVLLVELAKYQGGPATIIVLAKTAGGSGEVLAVGTSCSATDKDVLASVAVART